MQPITKQENESNVTYRCTANVCHIENGSDGPCSRCGSAVLKVEIVDTDEIYADRPVGFGPNERLPRTVEEVFPNAKPISEEDWQSYLNNSPDNWQEYEMVRRGE